MSKSNILPTVPEGSDSGESAGTSMAREHVYRLSSLDQASDRSYLRHCLGFALVSPEDREPAIMRLTETLRRTISQIPILAGRVRPISGNNTNRVEVVVTLNEVVESAPTTVYPDSETYPHTMKDLLKDRVPPNCFVNDILTPLPDTFDSSGPVFAVQMTFIPSGVIVAFYLHHSVADFVGLHTVMVLLSVKFPFADVSNSALHANTVGHSRLRDRLSTTRGLQVPQSLNLCTERPGPFTTDSSRPCTRMFCFKLDMIRDTRHMLHNRLRNMYNRNDVRLSKLQILSALLWKGINRAVRRSGAPESSPVSSLALAVSIRKHISPNPLPEQYVGNASFHHIFEGEHDMMSLQANITRLLDMADPIFASMLAVKEERIRVAIGQINGSSNVQTSRAKAAIAPDNCLVIVDQTDMHRKDYHLGLGLGKPMFARKLGRSISAGECIAHPIEEGDQVWQVQISLSTLVMRTLMEDADDFMKFVSHVV